MINRINPFNFAVPHQSLYVDTNISTHTIKVVYNFPANMNDICLYQKDTRIKDRFILFPRVHMTKFSADICYRDNNNSLIIDYFLYKFALLSGNTNEYINSVLVQITKKDIEFLWNMLTLYTYNSQKIHHRYVEKNLLLAPYDDKCLAVLNEFILRLEKLFEEALPSQVFYACIY